MIRRLLNEIREIKKEIEFLKKEHIYWTKEILDLEELAVKKMVGPFLEFEVHLADHCNLNCKGCDHFSPIASPKFASLDIFGNDMKRMSELFGNDVKLINLLGGEPLLNEQVSSFMKSARYYFQNNFTIINLVTNGILLLEKEDEFWHCCKENSVTISITKYPIDLDYDLIFKRAKYFEVKIEFYDPIEGDKTLYRLPLNLKGECDAKRSFYKCTSANKCCFLKEGKLYTCTLIPNIDHFNKYFNLDLPVTDEDYIDIYKAKSKEEIFNYLSKPKKFCRFCDSENKVYDLRWDKSKKKIGEWLL